MLRTYFLTIKQIIMMCENNKNKRLVVIARKYNDIFYAMSTKEWKNCNYHGLIIIPNRSLANYFPNQEYFDEIIIFPKDDNVISYRLFSFIKQIKRLLSNISADIVMMSNPEMFFNRIIFKYLKGNEIIFLEDGLMNYYHYKPTKNIKKKILSYIYSINDSIYLKKITSTYLTSPKLAKYYFGKIKQLKIDIQNFSTSRYLIPTLEGKKIFIAQDVLNTGEERIALHEKFFNCIIKQFNIDYYVPRTYDFKEHIDSCNILNINNIGITLEVLASKFNMEIFGFNTSSLYTLKLINRNTTTHRLTSDMTSHLKIPEIISANCDCVETVDFTE